MGERFASMHESEREPRFKVEQPGWFGCESLVLPRVKAWGTIHPDILLLHK